MGPPQRPSFTYELVDLVNNTVPPLLDSRPLQDLDPTLEPSGSDSRDPSASLWAPCSQNWSFSLI